MTIGQLVRATTRPFRRAGRALGTTDPDRARLRLAATTLLTFVVVVLVLFAGAAVFGLPGTAVVPGIVLAMIGSLAVRETSARRLVVSILLLVPGSLAAVTLASLLGSRMLVIDAVFVGVAVAAVYLRALGPRGTAVGMLAFVSYFLAVFVRITPAQLPVVVAAQVVSAALTLGARLMLRPRHPERDLLRVIAALGHRSGRVVAALADAVEAGALDDRLQRTLRSRLVASSTTASAAVSALEGGDEPIVDGIGNDELGVRVLDFQLAVEQLADAVRRLLSTDARDTGRSEVADRLRTFATTLVGPVPARRRESVDDPPAPAADVESVLEVGRQAWIRVSALGGDAGTPSGPPAEGEDADGGDAEEIPGPGVA